MKPSELNAKIQKMSDELEAVRAEKAVIIDRVGKKIDRVQKSKKISGEEFVEWRMGLYGLPEDDREAAVDAKLAELEQ